MYKLEIRWKVLLRLKQDNPEYTGRDFTMKNTDLPLKCKMIVGTGSVLDQCTVTGEAKQMDNVIVMIYNNPRVHYQGSHSLRSIALT